MNPARFILSLLGVALLLTIGTIFVIWAIARFTGAPMLDWETGTPVSLAAILLIVLVMRAALLWADNRKQKP
jgi:energy-coupling factor transporter transmembrane protein EcfT